ncbi:hypothetical protein [Streptomyces luteocolor]|uniref:hypothetical protein n=1 Tax=Streptomyces luteocolor TaxID=285500 RepID=UPI001EDB36CF|nr:hypothetical protein [Streptomyces luteocolor]
MNHHQPTFPVIGPSSEDTMAAFVAQATVDPDVAGLILSGSQAHEGMQTSHSDFDVHVVLREGASSPIRHLDGFRSAHLDLVVMTLNDFRRRGLGGDPMSWLRYAYVHAQVLFDGLDGVIGSILDTKRTLSPAEADAAAARYLDAYVNQTYRSLKNHRDGRPEPAHLDAAESIPFALEVVFALHQRVRPYNKFLQWELDRHPLNDGWSTGQLLSAIHAIHAILADGTPTAQRALFAHIEQAARTAGHDHVLDAWGEDLVLLRG